ncbi:MAG: M20/M25/M40 family metallo-hydrolase [Pseudomonadales bacterium]
MHRIVDPADPQRSYVTDLRTKQAVFRGTVFAVFITLIAGCGGDASETAVTADADATSAEAVHVEPVFNEQRLRRNIETLASDEFEGRQPASTGEAKTIKHLRDAFKALNLEPGNGESWFQSASLVSIEADAEMAMTISPANDATQARTLAYGKDFMAWTKRVEASSKLTDSELVFVGYGIVAPEYDWNDYDGVDMNGKTAVILVNDPGFATQDGSVFKGNAMTYYGRWTYKFEEAARQGAAGAIIVHESEAAGYPWDVVSGSWSGPQFDLYAEDKNMSRTQVEGWLTLDMAKSLFADAGQDYDALKQKALTGDFAATALGIKATVSFSNTIEQSDSRNVIALIKGSERPEETIVYTAHWDHLGKRQGEGDQIFNGAVDNATGTAALIELAAAFKALPKAPERSIVFLAVTAEESGLLGSKYYAENPVYDLASTIANINIDAANVHGPTHDVTVVGYGASELDDYLKRAADSQNRVIKPEPTPEKGYYYRSDHFNFAKKGVPALYAESGIDYRDQPEGWGLERQADYTANRYHKPGDEYQANWNLNGMLEDLGLYFQIGHELANSEAMPKWSEGSEFRAVRERSLKVAALPSPIGDALRAPGRSPEDLQRDLRSKPELVLDLLSLEAGDTVLDLFAGGAYYSSLLATVVGEEGKVWAHNNASYAKFAEKALEKRFSNGAPSQLVVIEREMDALALADESLDGMLAVMSYHDLHWVNEEDGWPAIDVENFYKQLHSALKPGGRVVIVDHSATTGSGLNGVGEYHRIDEAFVIRDFANNGFKMVESSDALRNADDPRNVYVFDPSIRGKTDRFILVFEKT